MSEEKVEWSEDQVVEAFGQFRNLKDSANNKEAEDRLRVFLKSLNKDFFECSDIYTITDQLVPPHCSSKLAMKVIILLKNDNSSAVSS